MRQALMGAAQLARTATQARRDAAERATRRDLEEARQLQAQLDAQRVAARAELAPVHESSWRDQAQVRDVARAYETAVTFRDEDQAARDAESRIRQELRDLAADVEHDAELSWDSAEKRELHVEGIKAGPDRAVAASAWKQADVDQARHPREAVHGGRKGKSPRTRVHAPTPDRQIGRDSR